MASNILFLSAMKVQEYFGGKTVWLTGASSGIGEQLAILLSPVAGRLVISARRMEELERVRKLCAKPANVFIQTIDLNSESNVREAAAIVLQQHGPVHILFANGGISQRALALETTPEVLRQIMEVNFFSQALLAQLVTHGRQHEPLHIVVTSTLLGKWGFHTRSAYSASKHALHGYFDSLRMEVEQQGIFITLVLPGFIQTDVSKNALGADGRPTREMDSNQAGGITAEVCAQRMLTGVADRKREFAVGGSEVWGLRMKRFFPGWFEKILRNKSAR
ncbi:MAG: SDR family NAD(P)-dependent oxidoreductase [Flavobacteriales bacterium]